jgi:hypothetical protein
MRTLSLIELFNLTRAELFALHAEIVTEITAEPADTAAYQIALQNLREIRQALARPSRRQPTVYASMVPH